MVFRAEEAKEHLFQEAVFTFTRQLPETLKEDAVAALHELVEEHGPIVGGYPLWHPLVAGGEDRTPLMWHSVPDETNGWGDDADHVLCFQRAFVACPYSDGKDLMRAAKAKGLRAQKLDTKLYRENTPPLLVEAPSFLLEDDGTISRREAVNGLLRVCTPRALEHDLYEPWDNVRRELMGSPYGKRSSLFVNEDTGNAMRKLLMALNASGIFGDESAPLNDAPRKKK